MARTLDNFHSHIERHADYILKRAPIALTVNEYVAYKIAHKLYAPSYFPQVVLKRITKKNIAMDIPNWKENFTNSIKCMMAVPVRTDKGVTHVLMVESIRRKWYTDHQKELAWLPLRHRTSL